MQVVKISMQEVLVVVKCSRFRDLLAGGEQLFKRTFKHGGKFKFFSKIVSSETSKTFQMYIQ